MLIFKFVQGGQELPEIYYLSETVVFSDVQQKKMFYSQVFTEDIGFNTIRIIDDVLFELNETLGISDNLHPLIYKYNIQDDVGFTDIGYQKDRATFIEEVGFNSLSSVNQIYVVLLNEEMGFTVSGNNAKHVDFVVTWRTRTKNPGIGYGGAEYGAIVSYGDGTASDLSSFRVEVYDGISNTLVRTTDISIVDTGNPDNDATFTYTSAMNIADNTIYQPNLIFKVYQIDTNSKVSPSKQISIEPVYMQ